ncbi:MAG: hypothetical protein U1F57_07575 [bacterium]
MGVLFEISMVKDCRVFIEKNKKSDEKAFFTAYVQLPNSEQFILDDVILPRLRKRLMDILEINPLVKNSA